MNQQEFDKVVAETQDRIGALLRVKGGEYAGSEDRLANFKRGAALTGCSSLQVLFIYLSKHYDAVATYVRDEAQGIIRERSESIEGRLDDLINYCILAKALVAEIEGLGAQKERNESIIRAQQIAMATPDIKLTSKPDWQSREYLRVDPEYQRVRQFGLNLIGLAVHEDETLNSCPVPDRSKYLQSLGAPTLITGPIPA